MCEMCAIGEGDGWDKHCTRSLQSTHLLRRSNLDWSKMGRSKILLLPAMLVDPHTILYSFNI